MRHRGTDVAIVACLYLGGLALTMIPLGLLGSLLSPMDIPAWRTGAVLAAALVVGAGMLFLARSLERGRAWARPVGIAVLAGCTVAVGLFTFMVATSPDAGEGAGLRAACRTGRRWIHVGGMYRTCDAGVRGRLSIAHRSHVMRRDEPSTKRSRDHLKDRAVTDLLIDCEEDRTLPPVLVGMLREMER
jgi:hypothetical protein